MDLFNLQYKLRSVNSVTWSWAWYFVGMCQ